MSSYYRDRDRDDDWDEPRSAVSVKRYVIPSEDRERERDYLFHRDSYPSERELAIRRRPEREDPIMVQRYERDPDYDRFDRDYYEREFTV